MQIAAVPRAALAGIVSATGSSSSHVAILARGFGVPAAMGVADLPVGRLEGLEMVVDGYRGRVYVAPGPVVRAEYRRLMDDDLRLTTELDVMAHEIHARRDSIQALRAELQVLDEQLEVMERMLAPAQAWAQQWNRLGASLTRRLGRLPAG